MTPAHRADHGELLRGAGSGTAETIDAIVVPTNRPADQLTTALDLADRTSSVLIVLASDDGPHPEDVAAVARRWPDSAWEVVQVPSDRNHALSPSRTFAATADSDSRHGLLGVKRSLGLALGRLVGWRRVLFLDDDIDFPEPGLIDRAAGGLGSCASIGFAVIDSPDNSVVCHANRLGGAEQRVFVSGSALLVDLTQPVNFFPTIYNEDWLFLFDPLRERAVGRVGQVHQRWHASPFGDPDRARREEFGEIIAEGLIDSLHHEVPLLDLVEATFWREFLNSRGAFIDQARARLESLSTDETEAALLSLAAAEARRRQISPELCSAFVRDWRADLVEWHEQLADLPCGMTFTGALDQLDLCRSEPSPVHPRRPATVVIDSTSVDLEFDVANRHGHRGLALVLPGFLDSIDYAASAGLADALADDGFATIRLDFRGSWRNESSLDDYRTSTHVEDLRRIIDQTDTSRVVVAGYCYGASVAAVAASLYGRISDVVALMPARHFLWADLGRDAPQRWRDGADHNFTRPHPTTGAPVTMTVPYTTAKDAREHDLAEAVSRFNCRALFVAGYRDGVVLPDQVADLHDQCASQDKEFIVLPVEHDYRDTNEDIAVVNRTVIEWLAEGNGSAGRPANSVSSASGEEASPEEHARLRL